MSEPNNRWMGQAAKVSGIGLLVLVSLVLGLAIGSWLDSKLGTKPWLAFVFTILGLAAGIYEAARILLGVIRDED